MNGPRASILAARCSAALAVATLATGCFEPRKICVEGTGTDNPPPTSRSALRDWLEAGEYCGWAAEDGPHPSSGPHFGDVQTYFSPTLEQSLADEADAHPNGAAAVKELYGDGDEVRGWAVAIKTADGTSGSDWYWYEFYDGRVVAEGQGRSVCVNCHAGGVDFVLSNL